MQTSCFKLLTAIFSMVLLALPSLAQPTTFTHIGGGPVGSAVDNGNGSYTLEGGGNDIWDTTDEFDFYHGPIVGNFDVRVRVESQEATARWAKAGVMAREMLTTDSRYAFARVSPEGPANNGAEGVNDTRLMYRTGLIDVGGPNGGQHEDGTGAPEFPNAWLRLERIGDVINGYASTDGLNWRLQNSLDIIIW